MVRADGLEPGRWPLPTEGPRLGTARVEAAAGRRIERIGDLAGDLDAARPSEGVRNRGDEGARVGMARTGEDRLPAPGLDDAAEIHHGDAVAHVLDDAEVVADHDVGQPEGVLELEQEIDDLRPDRNVER